MFFFIKCDNFITFIVLLEKGLKMYVKVLIHTIFMSLYMQIII